MKAKSKMMRITAGFVLLLCAVSARAEVNDKDVFKAIGKIVENPSDHTTNHGHELKFVRLGDGKEFDIVDSPELLAAHCEGERNSVLEIEGYRTEKFLFWGGDLVVRSFKVHADIEVPQVAHVKSDTVIRPARDRSGSRF